MASSNFRRLLIAVLAWPAGFLAAIGLLVIKGLASACRGGPCALEDISLLKMLFWIALALGPGIVATHHWWTNRKPRPNGEL
jgi:hypothetical protein